MNNNFLNLLNNELNLRNNPTDLKSTIHGIVVNLEPLTVSIYNGNVLLVHQDDMFLSEWFRFRCNIDAAKKLSETVPQFCDSAKNVTETHSYTGTSCVMSDAVLYLCEAISAVKDELLALKCNLKVNDIVILAGLEQEDKYILLDKAV